MQVFYNSWPGGKTLSQGSFIHFDNDKINKILKEYSNTKLHEDEMKYTFKIDAIDLFISQQMSA